MVGSIADHINQLVCIRIVILTRTHFNLNPIYVIIIIHYDVTGTIKMTLYTKIMYNIKIIILHMYGQITFEA